MTTWLTLSSLLAQTISWETSGPKSLPDDGKTTAKLRMHILHLWRDTYRGWHLNIAIKVIRTTERAGVYQTTLISSSVYRQKTDKGIRPPVNSIWKKSTSSETWCFWDGLWNFPSFNFLSVFLDAVCVPWSSFSLLTHLFLQILNWK